MNVDEARGLTTAELEKQLRDARQELFNLRLRLSARQLDNHRQIVKTKRGIARVKTILRERELAGQL